MPTYRVRVGETTTETDTSSSEDFPRESLGRIVINYAPSALIVLGFLLYPTAVGYLWIDAAFYWIGSWAYIPVAFVGAIALVVVLVIKALPSGQDPRDSSNSPTVSIGKSMETVVRVCRAACILWHLFFALLLVLFVILVPTQIIRENYLAVALLFTVICGWCYFIFSSYQWYVRCWYEKAIIAQNEQIYGPTIYVSIPVFKLCGHFILVIRDHKYELRLDASTRNRPVFRERPLSLKESEDIRNAFGHNWFVVGWTQRTDDQIKATFTDVIESFGLYHRLRNNCRHFLQSGTMSILDSAATWHEDMLLVGSSLDIAIPKMTLMMWRSMQRDLYRWYWARRYGPDWEALASKQFNDRAMIEDLMDHTFDLSGNSEEAQTFDFKFHERVLDFCCPWIFALICIVVLVTFSIWVNTTEAPSQANMPLSLLIGVYSVSIVVSVILIIYGCCRV